MKIISEVFRKGATENANASEIYTQSVKRLQSVERLRLATLILEDLTEEQTITFKNGESPAWELLESLSEKRLFQTADEVDEHLREERESWER